MSLTWQQTDALLKLWGGAQWKVSLSGGYPEQSAVSGRIEIYVPREWFQPKQLTAKGRSDRHFGGHRILEWPYDPPKWLKRVHFEVCKLPDPQFDAVCANYAVEVKYGLQLSQKAKAELLEITPDALQERLRRARLRLSKKLATATELRVVLGYRGNTHHEAMFT